MKKLLKLLCCFAAVGLMASCSSQEDEIATPSGENMEFSMLVSLPDIDTRAGQGDCEDCEPQPNPNPTDPSTGDDGNNLKCINPNNWVVENYRANITIQLFGDPNREESIMVDLFELEDGSIVTDRISLVNPGNRGDHKLVNMTIVKKNNPSMVLYSAVGEDSKYKVFVKEDHLLPMNLAFGSILNNFQKPVIPITLICAVHNTAPDFGFAIWDLNVVKIKCRSYVANMPADIMDGCGSLDVVANTVLKATYYACEEDWMTTPFMSKSGIVDGEYVLGQFCNTITANCDYENQMTSLVIVFTNPAGQSVTFERVFNLNELNLFLDRYSETPLGAEDDEYVLHFDLNQAICDACSDLAIGEQYFIMSGKKTEAGMFELTAVDYAN